MHGLVLQLWPAPFNYLITPYIVDVSCIDTYVCTPSKILAIIQRREKLAWKDLLYGQREERDIDNLIWQYVSGMILLSRTTV